MVRFKRLCCRPGYVDLLAKLFPDDEDEEDYDEEDVVYEPELEGLSGTVSRLLSRLERLRHLTEDMDLDDDPGNWGFDEAPQGLLRHHHHLYRLPADPWRVEVGSADDRFGGEFIPLPIAEETSDRTSSSFSLTPPWRTSWCR